MTKFILKSIHVILALIGFVIWGVANAFYSVCIGLSLIADRVIPGASKGNCWSYTFARWWKYGGYLAIRKADGNGFIKFLPLPHVIWLKRIDWKFADVEQLIPKVRKHSKWFPWYSIYFDGKVINKEFRHDATIPQ